MVSLILFVVFMVIWLVELVTPQAVMGRWAPFLAVFFLAVHLLGLGTLGHF